MAENLHVSSSLEYLVPPPNILTQEELCSNFGNVPAGSSMARLRTKSSHHLTVPIPTLPEKKGSSRSAPPSPEIKRHDLLPLEPEEDPENEDDDTPPPHVVDPIRGYESVSFAGVVVQPPPPIRKISGNPPTREELVRFRHMTETEAQQAIVDYVRNKFFCKKAPARHMTIENVTTTCAFYYKLETFTEKRETSWKFEPYRGGLVDSTDNGPAPHPWCVSVPQPTPFEPSQTVTEVPHTASVKPCHVCKGAGKLRCRVCHGHGKMVCSWCLNIHNHRCVHCSRTGHVACTKCSGNRLIKCKICSSIGLLKYFIQLTVTWQILVDEKVVEAFDLPQDLIKKSSSKTVFTEEMNKVFPLTGFSIESLNKSSEALISKHEIETKMRKICRQRHQIETIPLGKVIYSWKDMKNKSFVVYGYDKQVYAPEYPQRCSLL